MKKMSNGIALITNTAIAIGCIAWAVEVYEGSVLQDKIEKLTSKIHKKS